jgi:hypothetical protein
VTVIDSVGVSQKDGAIALVYLSQLEDLNARLEQLSETLRDKAVLIAYTSMDKVGSSGEEELLTIANGELRRFVRLGTPEAEAAIREIALLAKKRRAYEDEEDEEVE